MCFLSLYILNQKKKKTQLTTGIFFVFLPTNHLLGGVDAKQGKVVSRTVPGAC